MFMENKTLYTITIFSENTVGLLGQVTGVFVRRQINIETLSVSPSAIPGIHKFTITVYSNEATIKKIVSQIDKRVDVLKSYFNVDSELIYQEIALYKISTDAFLELKSVENLIRNNNARILEINKNCVVIEKTGHQEETKELFDELSKAVGVLQFIRSGRVAVNTSKVERLSDLLIEIDQNKPKKD